MCESTVDIPLMHGVCNRPLRWKLDPETHFPETQSPFLKEYYHNHMLQQYKPCFLLLLNCSLGAPGHGTICNKKKSFQFSKWLQI